MDQRKNTEELPAGNPHELGFVPERLNQIGSMEDAEVTSDKELFGLFFTQAPGFPFPTALQFEKMTQKALC